MDPPDRSHIRTEQRHPGTINLHRLSAQGIVRTIVDADRGVHDAIDDAASQISQLIEDAERGFCAGGRIIYVGAGTSGRLGVLDASEAPPTFQVEPGRVVGLIAGGDRALRVSSEGLEDDPEGALGVLTELGLTADDTVIGIAAGGTTPYPRGALTIAKRLCPKTLTAMLTCSPVMTPDNTDHHIVVDVGPEVVTGSTRMKAGTATKMVLNIISTTLMIRSGRVYENLMVDLRATNDKLRDRGARIISTVSGVDRERALELLEASGGAVKAAIVMERRGVGLDEAEALLASADGRLDRLDA